MPLFTFYVHCQLFCKGCFTRNFAWSVKYFNGATLCTSHVTLCSKNEVHRRYKALEFPVVIFLGLKIREELIISCNENINLHKNERDVEEWINLAIKYQPLCLHLLQEGIVLFLFQTKKSSLK